ncbi:MAG: TRAP transporter large permease, partial [Roseinatronobacter sp.]
ILALIYIFASGNTVMLESYGQQLFGGLENYGLLALPLFILLGEFMNAGGIGRRLMAFAMALLGSVRGGLAYVTLLANMMMASILGSAVAQITVMSRLAVPEMVKAGYPRDVSVAITAAGGILAPILPPSMIFIIFGVIAQISIGDLFIAGIVPGLMLSGAFIGVIAWIGYRRGFPANRTLTLRERISAIWRALPAASIPVVIVGSILGGLATPTEAAALASLMAVFVGLFIYREMTLADLMPAFLNAARNSALVMFLIAAASLFSWVITFANLPAIITAFMQSLTTSPVVFLLLVMSLLLLLGTITDAIPAIILTVPVLLPVATAVYGIDPLQFGIVVCLSLTLGLFTPPVGTALFAAALMGNVKAERLTVLLLPFFLATLIIILLLVIFPQLSLSLMRVL